MVEDSRLRDIAQRLFPNKIISDISVITLGWTSEIAVMNGEYIIKIPRGGSSLSLKKEISITNYLKDKLPVRIPQYTVILDDGKLEAAAYRKIEGIMLTSQEIPEDLPYVNPWEFLSGRNAEIVARQIANILNAIHGLDTTEMSELLKPFAHMSWEDLILTDIEDAKTISKIVFSGNFLDSCLQFLEKLTKQIHEFDFDLRFVHGDFGGWNILFNKDELKITGLLDWGGCCIGDPATDFKELIYDFGEEFTFKVLKYYAYPSDDTLIQRARLYLQLAGFLDLKHGVESKSEFFTKKGISVITNLIKSSE